MGADIIVCRTCGGVKPTDSFGGKLTATDAAIFGMSLCAGCS